MEISIQRIERVLAEKGMSKTELALRCGVSRQNISVITRRGSCEPKTAGRLAAGLGVSVNDITLDAGA